MSSSPWPVTIDGVTFNESDLDPYTYRQGFPEMVKRVANTGAAAETAKTGAQTARTQTETARDQAQTAVATGRVSYDTLAALNANLTPAAGAQGEVLNDGANNGLYVKSGASGAGSWTKKSNASITALDFRTRTMGEAETVEGDLYRITDSAGRLLLRIGKDGTLYGKKFQDSDVVSTLNRPFRTGTENLRETRQRLRKLALGDAGTQLVIACLGDSWTHFAARWTGPFTETLIAQFGDAGGGYTGFAWPSGTPALINGNVRPSLYGVTVTGNWTPAYSAAPTPDLGAITSTTAGDAVQITAPANTPFARLFYLGTGAGAIRYRFNGGAFTSLDVSGSGLMATILSGAPAGAWTLDLEVVSGTVTLGGVDLRANSGTSGVRVHKLGATGSRLQQNVAQPAADRQYGLGLLVPNLVVMMFGTNDQLVYQSSGFYNYYETEIARVRAALPAADILIVMPCENFGGRPNPMSSYADAAYQLAVAQGCAFLDLQPLFGKLAEYSSAGIRPWFNADGFHPDPASGGRAIVDAILRTVLYA